MTKMLTEIGSHSLFHEYLNVLGIANPALAKVEQLWEHKRVTSSTPAPSRSTDTE